MSEVAEVQRAVIGLSKSQYSQFVSWLIEYDWEQWDRQIEVDSGADKLDFLAFKALESKRRGTLTDL